MYISKIRDEREFLELEKDWNELLSRSKSNTIFLTWEWICAWWKNFRGSRELFVLVARDEADEIVGIAPLYIVKSRFMGFLFLKRLGFIGDESAGSEYLDFIIAEGREEGTLGGFFSYLEENKEQWDIAILREIPETSTNLKYLRLIAKEKKYTFSREDTVCCSFVLPEDWNSYLMSLSQNFRRNIRSGRRRTGERGKVVFSMCSDGDLLEARLNSLFKLHQERWVQAGFEGSFAEPNKRQFYRDIALSSIKKNLLRFYSLEMDGDFVAHLFGFEYNEKYFELQEGWDINYGNLKVGNVLKSYVVEDLISRGVKEFDYLGEIEKHKRDWGATPKYSAHVLFGRSNLKNELFRWIPAFIEGGKQIMKKLLPQRLVEYRRKRVVKIRERKVRQNAERLLSA